ncbi:hypothetical protein [Microbacterium sp. OR16]|uniref:hypothetical protein n=1 Tax=Microbacterium sp. OR16 TaxID=3095345 RepID=UPI0039B5835E
MIRTVLVALAAVFTWGALVGRCPASDDPRPDPAERATADLWAAIDAEDADATIRAIEDAARGGGRPEHHRQ